MELTLPAQQTPINYNVNVEDNFMPLDWCQEVFNELTHIPGRNAYFPWYCAEILSPNAPQSTLNCHPLKNVHFSHNFYHYGNSCSDYGHLIQPLIDKINPDVLYRAKANLNLYDEQPIKHGYHIDESFNGLTSILYLNTCDGSTSFKVGEEIVDVDAVQGRFITFDNRMLHSGSSTSNANSRVVFVINYYKHEVALQLGPEPIRITIPEQFSTMTDFFPGQFVTYREHSGYVNFIGDSYITLCIKEYCKPSEDVEHCKRNSTQVNVLVFRECWNEVYETEK